MVKSRKVNGDEVMEQRSMVKGCMVDGERLQGRWNSPSTLRPFTIDLVTFHHRPCDLLPSTFCSIASSPSTLCLFTIDLATYWIYDICGDGPNGERSQGWWWKGARSMVIRRLSERLMVKGCMVDGERSQGRWNSPSILRPFTIDLVSFHHRPCDLSPSTIRSIDLATYWIY